MHFPLYHGTSSHYLDAFQIGKAPSPWLHMDDAINLLRNTCIELKRHGQDPEWFLQNVLDQNGGHSNWRHGALYATPSKYTAGKYAISNCEYGGELLTFCRISLEKLQEHDKERSQALIEAFPSISSFLCGGGKPLLIEISELKPSDLSTEIEGRNVQDQIIALSENEILFELLGQQANFIINSGCGIVTAVTEIEK